MSENKLGAAVIGLGIGRHHVTGYQACPGVDMVAACDINEQRLEERGAGNGVTNLYVDYREMLARDDIDVVSVCTPNHLHAEMAIEALKRGKHVLSEKPMALNADQGQAMMTAAQQANRVLRVTFNHRKRGDVQALKAFIDEGGLGRIYHAKAWWLRRNGIPGMGSWFTQKAAAGGGPLIDLGVHMLDMALYLLGEPEPTTVSASVYAELGTQGKGGNPSARKQPMGAAYEVEDLANAFIRFSNNSTMTLETSWATYRENNDDLGVILYGTKGGAHIHVVDYVQDDTLRIFVDIAATPVDIVPYYGKNRGHHEVVADFIGVVRSGDWENERGYEGLKRTKIIDACYHSAEQGHEVVL